MLLKTASLPNKILNIIHDKGTEPPFSGEYDNNNQLGTYLCRQCGLALFRAQAKFISTCGWPSFDEAISHTIAFVPDADGLRMEILCARCKAHLGHVFYQEGYTQKNVRYCVNSLSVDFVDDLSVIDTEEAIFAAGCFWGVQYYFDQLKGILKTEVGYIGGQDPDPFYKKVCTGKTGYYEAVRVLYDPLQINYEKVVKYFFEIHDPTQIDGQGPDKGSQYLSRIFYYTKDQYQTCVELIDYLTQLGDQIATEILPVTTFWRAEGDHQKYYAKSHHTPYCHRYQKKF